MQLECIFVNKELLDMFKSKVYTFKNGFHRIGRIENGNVTIQYIKAYEDIKKPYFIFYALSERTPMVCFRFKKRPKLLNMIALRVFMPILAWGNILLKMLLIVLYVPYYLIIKSNIELYKDENYYALIPSLFWQILSIALSLILILNK